MKKPKPKDFNLNQEFIDEVEKEVENPWYYPSEKIYWLIIASIAFWIGANFDDVELWSGGHIIASIFLMLPTMMIIGVGGMLLSELYYEFILPLFNQKYSNLKKYKKELKKYEEWFFRTQLDFWRSLSGRQFEIELARLLQKHGHEVKVVGGAGDKGIDLIVDGDTAVQCKAHKSKVGPASIRDLIGSMKNAKYKRGILASINGFTTGVYDYNKKNNIKLLDASNYIQLQKELSDG